MSFRLVTGFGVITSTHVPMDQGYDPFWRVSFEQLKQDCEAAGLGIFCAAQGSEYSGGIYYEIFITPDKQSPDRVFKAITSSGGWGTPPLHIEKIKHGDIDEDLIKEKQSKFAPLIEKYQIDTEQFFEGFGEFEFGYFPSSTFKK